MPVVRFVRVHVPEVGRLLKIIVPVGTLQVGCVIFPVAGAAGITGGVFTVAPADATEIQPDELVTVYV